MHLRVESGALLLGLVLTASARAQTPLTLDAAFALAASKNLELQQRSADVDVAQARIEGASVLLNSNPNVVLSLGPRSSNAGRSLQFSGQLTQQIEVAGQRGARVDAAEAGLGAATAQLQAARSRLRSEVRTRFGRALAADQRLRLAQESLKLAQESFSAADERFRAGSAPLLEVNTARVELGRVNRARAEAQRAQAVARSELRVTLGLEVSEPLEPEGELVDQEQPLPDEKTLVERALKSRFELEQARRTADAARARALLASREWVPSPSVGFSLNYEQESQATIAQGVLAFDLPLFERNQGPRGAASAQARQAELALLAVERGVVQEVNAAFARVVAARAAAEGYRGDVVKAMQENMDLVNESYRAGKIDFLQLVVIRRQALEARREFIDVLEELNAAQAELELAIGGP